MPIAVVAVPQTSSLEKQALFLFRWGCETCCSPGTWSPVADLDALCKQMMSVCDMKQLSLNTLKFGRYSERPIILMLANRLRVVKQVL